MSEPIADIAARYYNSPDKFPLKKVLWIGSESYVAPAITVLQGLDILGFEIYTPYKENINSWFCDRQIDQDQIMNMDFDFALSATHWGTDYPVYRYFGLEERLLKVLIDGDDAAEDATWLSRHKNFSAHYGHYPKSKRRKKVPRFPARWMAPLTGYEPDVLFTMQKQFGGGGIYLPSGIHREYFESGRNHGTADRYFDFAHFKGPGVWRKAMSDLIDLGLLPNGAEIFNGNARGEPIYNQQIADHIVADRDINVHSFHRWVTWQAFYDVLNNTKMLIHPGIDYHPFWDCKRPYEGWACGCLVFMRQPCTDTREYPITDIWPSAVFESDEALADKALYYYQHENELDLARKASYNRALEFLMPEPVARYFLGKIYEFIS